ncbi:MAG: formylglycine-generating enzyme family protein [Magnetovibrionaceae bacterium]
MTDVIFRQTRGLLLAGAVVLAGLLGVPHAAPVLAQGLPPAFSEFKDCPDCPTMVMLPAGVFVMGENGRNQQEMPAHPVTIPKPFAVGKFEVTFDQWDACHAAGGCRIKPHDHKWGRGSRPVINITWDEAQEYVRWLSRETGANYRLLSDAEWEYAARAGTTTAFFWGDDPGANQANCRDCKSPWSKKGSGPVGSFEPNPWGLYDMHGNVWEWIEDCWNPNHIGAPRDGSARETGDCRQKVIRSGSWYYFSRNARSAWRFKNDGRVKSYNIGLRVARDF